MGKLNQFEREEIIRLLMQGKSQSSVAKMFEVSQPAIRKLWIKFKSTGTVVDMLRSGRPTKTTSKDRKRICLYAKRRPFSSSFDIQASFKNEINVSARTIRKILCDGGLYGRISAMKPFLTSINMKRRMAFCKSYSKFSLDQWKNIIFSDECRIMKYSAIRRYVRRPIGSRFKSRYILKYVRQTKLNIMVWGAIKGDGSRIIVRCPNRLNSSEYQNVLDQGLYQVYSPENIFMQDNATCHKSISTIQYLDRNNICMLSDWPARSPDLNIIENLWSLLKKNVGQRQSNSPDEFWKIIQEEWYKIPDNYIYSLYSSMSRRLGMVLSSHGDSIKY